MKVLKNNSGKRDSIQRPRTCFFNARALFQADFFSFVAAPTKKNRLQPLTQPSADTETETETETPKLRNETKPSHRVRSSVQLGITNPPKTLGSLDA